VGVIVGLRVLVSPAGVWVDFATLVDVAFIVEVGGKGDSALVEEGEAIPAA
jgi:hypothetical protein